MRMRKGEMSIRLTKYMHIRKIRTEGYVEKWRKGRRRKGRKEGEMEDGAKIKGTRGRRREISVRRKKITSLNRKGGR
jgi:hypothetical protein